MKWIEKIHLKRPGQKAREEARKREKEQRKIREALEEEQRKAKAIADRENEIERGKTENIRKRLINCFYGTLADRKPGGVRTTRQRHLHDGWREGYSHPLEYDGKTYDVQENGDASLRLFNGLLKRLDKRTDDGSL